ncbi:MAG: cell division protein ZapA [Rhodobacteraceae bacterium]|nr:cell division protein ZapA [Paracoccaceae bacterium]
MPEVNIAIGGRLFEVACQEGEQRYLEAAARLLDREAAEMTDQLGRMPESRMLLMAGLMLADKTTGLEDRLRELERQISDLQAELDAANSRPPVRVEVPVIPQALGDGLAELAARAEALADDMESPDLESAAAE